MPKHITKEEIAMHGLKHVWQTSFRFYLIQNRWIGIDDIYGQNNVQANQNYNSVAPSEDPNPNYTMRGFVAPFDCIVESITFRHNRINSNGNTIHLCLLKQQKLEGSTAVNNTVLHKDTVGFTPVRNIHNGPIKHQLNEGFDEGEYLGIMWNKSTGDGTDYLYCDVEIIFKSV